MTFSNFSNSETSILADLVACEIHRLLSDNGYNYTMIDDDLLADRIRTLSKIIAKLGNVTDAYDDDTDDDEPDTDDEPTTTTSEYSERPISSEFGIVIKNAKVIDRDTFDSGQWIHTPEDDDYMSPEMVEEIIEMFGYR